MPDREETKEITRESQKPVMWKVILWTILGFWCANWVCGLPLGLLLIIVYRDSEPPQTIKNLVSLINIVVAIIGAVVAYKRSKARGGKAPWKSFTLQLPEDK